MPIYIEGPVPVTAMTIVGGLVSAGSYLGLSLLFAEPAAPSEAPAEPVPMEETIQPDETAPPCPETPVPI